MPDFYQDLKYPEPPNDRPYVVINMVTTIDGKIITGERGEPVHDLGSATDHAMMRREGDVNVKSPRKYALANC